MSEAQTSPPTLDAEMLKQAAQAMFMAQESRDINKRLSAKPEEKTLAEIFFGNNPIFKERRTKREEQYKSDLHYQQVLAKHFIDNDMGELLPTLFGKAGDEDFQKSTQSYLARLKEQFASRAQVAAPYLEAMNKPVEGPAYTGEMAKVLAQYQDQGASMTPGRPPTTQEQGQRVTQAATDPKTSLPMVMAMQAFMGPQAGKTAQDQLQLIQRQSEQGTPEQKQQAMDEWIKTQQADRQSKEAQAAKDLDTIQQRKDSQKRIDDFTDQPQGGQTPGKQSRGSIPAILQRASAMKLDVPLVTAIYGNEGSGDTSVSPKGAIGRGQIMPATAYSEYGITEDKLKDPEINATTALRYMSDLSLPGGRYYKRTLGKPEAVLAAYFSGPGNVENGEVKDWTKSDGNMTVRQYVDSGMKRYRQAQASTQTGTAAPQDTEANAVSAAPKSPQAQSQTLQPYKRTALSGTTQTSTGALSTDFDQARQKSAEAHIEQHNPLLYPEAYADAIKAGDSPSEPKLKLYRDAHTQAKMQQLSNDPSLRNLPPGEKFHEVYSRAQETTPTLFFNPEVAQKSLSPGEQTRLQSRERVIGESEGKLDTRAQAVQKQEIAGRISESVQTHTKIAEAKLDEPIDNPDILLNYPGSKSGMTKRQLNALEAKPKSPASQKDEKTVRAALDIVDSLETRFKKTQPPEYFVTAQRLARQSVNWLTHAELANETYNGIRDGQAQALGRALSGGDTRFSVMEEEALKSSIPTLYTRASVAKELFADMRATLKRKLGDPETKASSSEDTKDKKTEPTDAERAALRQRILDRQRKPE